jgi:fluoroacetyl-CoA thioesterase
MKNSPRVGTSAEQKFVVGPGHLIDFAEGGMPAILCTPWLIWFLEHAARQAVLSSLEASESTVGTHIDVDHLAATPLGQTVTCRARIVHVEGPRISLQLQARDEDEVIAKGFHKLLIIRVERFARKVQRKARSS